MWNDCPELQKYVGKFFYHHYIEIEILDVYDGLQPFFLCMVSWTQEVFCVDPIHVLPLFDDDMQPYDDYGVAAN